MSSDRINIHELVCVDCYRAVQFPLLHLNIFRIILCYLNLLNFFLSAVAKLFDFVLLNLLALFLICGHSDLGWLKLRLYSHVLDFAVPFLAFIEAKAKIYYEILLLCIELLDEGEHNQRSVQYLGVAGQTLKHALDELPSVGLRAVYNPERAQI